MNFTGKLLPTSFCAPAVRDKLFPHVPKRPSQLGRPYLAIAAFAATLAAGTPARATPTLTTLATFTGTNDVYPYGASPWAGLIADASGNLYGTSGGIGTSYGTVFQVAAGTHALSVLASFNSNNGADPKATLIADSAGNLYGTTSAYGSGGYGTVFEIAAGTHALSTLVNFDNTNGARPLAGLIADAAGNLYGTTMGDGTGTYGTVFGVAVGTHALSTLVTFNNNNGAHPQAGLIADAAGNLYGTTAQGGALNYGTVFEVAAGTHVLSTPVTFDNNNGSGPHGDLIADAAGNLYGTTYRGGTLNYGTVFEVAAGTHVLSTLVTFNNNNGNRPEAGLIADAAGNLYGTTAQAGPGGYGTVFEVASGTHALSTLAYFNKSNGAGPVGDLLADSAGNLYGTTAGGGTSNAGTVFELSKTGFVTSTPEPVALSLIGFAGLGLLMSRRSPCSGRLPAGEKKVSGTGRSKTGTTLNSLAVAPCRR